MEREIMGGSQGGMGWRRGSGSTTTGVGVKEHLSCGR